MKLFIGFLVLCFFGGLLFRKAGPARRLLALLAVCLFLCFAFYFLNQI